MTEILYQTNALSSHFFCDNEALLPSMSFTSSLFRFDEKLVACLCLAFSKTSSSIWRMLTLFFGLDPPSPPIPPAAPGSKSSRNANSFSVKRYCMIKRTNTSERTIRGNVMLMVLFSLNKNRMMRQTICMNVNKWTRERRTWRRNTRSG